MKLTQTVPSRKPTPEAPEGDSGAAVQANRSYGFGRLILLIFLLQILSGLYLAMFYQPAPAASWKSIVFMEKNIFMGEFFRSLHRWSALLAAIFLGLHILDALRRGSYRSLRGWRWWSGILLLLLFVAFALTGYLLPWDFRAYWMTLTMNNWLEKLPLFSSVLRWLLLEETPDGIVPVARWFALHTLALPLLSGLLLRSHFVLKDAPRRSGREQGASPSLTARLSACLFPDVAGSGKNASRSIRRYAPAVGTLLLLFWLATFGILKQVVADPITTSPLPQPDWLFLLFFQVTRYFQDHLEIVGVFWLPLFILGGMSLLPFLDRSDACRKWARRTALLSGLGLFLALAVVTSHTGSTTPVWSCPACHKESFGRSFANTPHRVADFSARYDNRWLSLHSRYPQYFWMMDAHVPAW